MKTIEHRRHTIRTQPGQHLSQEGVRLARRVGEELGEFDLVVTSPLPRAFETAIAMGYAVDRQDELLGTVPDGLGAVWDAGFAHLAAIVRDERAAWAVQFADALAGFHRNIAEALPNNGRALIVSHGGTVELAAISCTPHFDFADWTQACSYCEGVTLPFDGNTFEDPTFLGVA